MTQERPPYRGTFPACKAHVDALLGFSRAGIKNPATSALLVTFPGRSRGSALATIPGADAGAPYARTSSLKTKLQ